MQEKNWVFDVSAISDNEAVQINGGGTGFEWLGKVIGRINQVVTEACNNGYFHAGLFY